MLQIRKKALNLFALVYESLYGKPVKMKLFNKPSISSFFFSNKENHLAEFFCFVGHNSTANNKEEERIILELLIFIVMWGFLASL